MSFIQQSWANTDSIIREILQTRLTSGDDDSFYIFNVLDVVKKLEFWTEKFPRVKPFYAMKANHSDEVISTMAKLGTGFDCASKNEIRRILELGVHPDKIIYANPSKQVSHLKFARAKNVTKMTFDNIDELIKIKAIFPEARVVMRIRYDAEKTTLSFGEKFGCDPELEAPELIRKCKDLKLDLIGMSFHAGNELQDHQVFYKAIKAIKKLFDFAATVGMKFNFFDIGGGFDGRDMKQVEECARFINSAIEEFFPDQSIEVIAEPGLFFMQTAFKLLCCVNSRRVQKDDKGRVARINYFVNNGVFGSFLRNYLYGIQLVPRVFLEVTPSKNAPHYESILWGQTCDSTDKMFQLTLPEMQVGDWMIFDENVGAYSRSRGTEFNGFDRAEMVVLPLNDVSRNLLM